MDFPDRYNSGFLGDPTGLRQIVLNLMGNAVKFTDSGSVGLKVKTRNLSQGICKVKIQVIDTGVGIPRDRLPFYAKSEPGKGSVFTVVITLPEMEISQIKKIQTAPLPSYGFKLLVA